jgi:hypothetical protein
MQKYPILRHVRALQLDTIALKKRTRQWLDIGHVELIDTLTFGEVKHTPDTGKIKT